MQRRQSMVLAIYIYIYLCVCVSGGNQCACAVVAVLFLLLAGIGVIVSTVFWKDKTSTEEHVSEILYEIIQCKKVCI